MVTLYIAEHTTTKLKYFGKSERYHDIDSLLRYKGSGLYWRRHLKTHGNDINMTILCSSEDLEFIEFVALEFSEMNDIVESVGYANLKFENGLDGNVTGSQHSEETKIKIRDKAIGRTYKPKTLKQKQHIAKVLTNKRKTPTHARNMQESKKARGRYFNIFDKDNTMVMENVWRVDLMNINQALLKATKDKRLGRNHQSKRQLNLTNKLHMIGWYSEEIFS